MRRLVLFAKRPLLGQVKTRLVPPLRPEQALALYRAFLFDQLRFARSLAPLCEGELCLDRGGSPDAAVRAAADGLRVSEQGPGDLGHRMLHAFQRSLSQGAEATVILGVDAPTLPRERVIEAFERLAAGAAAVLVPAADGGYVLLGLRRPIAELFRRVPWGTAEVLEVTRRRAVGWGVVLHELEPWYDVDDRAALARLQRDLARPRFTGRAPATARALADIVGESGTRRD